MNYLRGLEDSAIYMAARDFKPSSGPYLDTNKQLSYAGVKADIVSVSSVPSVVTGVSNAISSVFGFLTSRNVSKSQEIYSSMQPQAQPASATPMLLGLGAIGIIGTIFLATR